MSTTIRRVLWSLPVILIGWISVMAIVRRVSDAAPGAVVVLPSERLMRHLPDDAAILGINRIAVTLSNRPDLAADLYRAGALLVLPAGLTGCLPLTGAQRADMARRNGNSL